MPLSFLHIFCSGFPLLSEINNNTAVTNPLFSTALVKSRSENSLSFRAFLTSNVATVWPPRRREIGYRWSKTGFFHSARKSNLGGGEASWASSFSPTFFFSIDLERKKKRKQKSRNINRFPRFFELEGKVGWRERDRESFHSDTSEGRAVKGPPISLN